MTIGRPTDYTKELADKICQLIAEGNSVRTICKPKEMPNASSIYLWLRTYDDFSKQYTKASNERATARYESIDEILDRMLSGEIDTQQAKLIVDTKKWQCGKEQPKKYGDAALLKHADADGGKLSIQVVSYGDNTDTK